MRVIINKPPIVPLEEGAYPAVVFSVQEVGEVPSFDGKGLTYCVGIGFEIPSQTLPDGSCRFAWKQANAETLHPKSTLAKIAAACGIVVPEGGEFNPTELVGKNLTVIVKHNVQGDRTYANITDYTKLGKGAVVVAPQHPADTPMPAWLKTPDQRKQGDNPPAQAVLPTKPTTPPAPQMANASSPPATW